MPWLIAFVNFYGVKTPIMAISNFQYKVTEFGDWKKFAQSAPTSQCEWATASLPNVKTEKREESRKILGHSWLGDLVRVGNAGG